MSSCNCEDGGNKGSVKGVTISEPEFHKGKHTILLLGNPNVGKSTLFNALTGAHQHVRNAPGTTVEVFSGTWKALDSRLIDMPGTYSLLPNSPDEEVVVDAMAGAENSLTDPDRGRGADLVVCVMDATAISRSLYLLGQAAQTGLPIICAVTMNDIAEASGQGVDCAALSKVVGVPVIEVDPRHKRGLQVFTEAVQDALISEPRVVGLPVDPGAPGYNRVAGQKLANLIATTAEVNGNLNQPLPEDGCESDCCCKEAENDPALMEATTAKETKLRPKSLPPIESKTVDEVDRATRLFEWIEKVETELGKVASAPDKPSRSDKVDKVLLNPWFGIPIFMVAMYVVFWLCNTFAALFQEPLEFIFDNPDGWGFDFFGLWGFDGVPGIATGVQAIFEGTSWEGGALHNFLISGLLTGIGVVTSFAPLMIMMFIAIAFMEDSGYMARVAFLGDRVMRLIGLDGRVIMPFIVGFGCNLPTLAALRTLPNSRQRIMAVILTPYITCNARFVVYMLIARIFFPDHASLVVWSMYFLSIIMVVLGGLALKPFIMRGQTKAPLMLVLPPYQTPRSLIILKSAASRTWAFLKGAGKVIVVMACIVWALMATPVAGEGRFGDELPVDESAYGVVSSALAPVFAPAGFDDWHLAGGLIAGFVAKETMISTLATTYSAHDCTEEESALASEYNEMSDEELATELADDPAKLKAVQAAMDKRCAGVHLGASEADDPEPTVAMADLVRDTFTKTAGSEALAGLAAFAFLIFVLTYTPCLATVGEQWRQLGRWRTLAAVGGQLLIAWILAVLVFQVGSLFIG